MRMRIGREELEKLARQVVLDALEERGAEPPADFGPGSRLFGRGAPLDSLGLVSVVTEIEERLEEEQGLTVVLADERAMSRRASPFRTLASLVDYLEECVGNARDA
jgi:acyl carrier protein